MEMKETCHVLGGRECHGETGSGEARRGSGGLRVSGERRLSSSPKGGWEPCGQLWGGPGRHPPGVFAEEKARWLVLGGEGRVGGGRVGAGV